MARATLIIHTTDGDITAEFDVQTPDEVATIEILPTDVKIHTTKEPKIVRQS